MCNESALNSIEGNEKFRTVTKLVVVCVEAGRNGEQVDTMKILSVCRYRLFASKQEILNLDKLTRRLLALNLSQVLLASAGIKFVWGDKLQQTLRHLFQDDSVLEMRKTFSLFYLNYPK